MTGDARKFKTIDSHEEDGNKITFGDNSKGTVRGLDVRVINVKDSSLIFKGFRYENLYLVDFDTSEAKISTCLISKSSMGWLWHRRLGHVGMKQLKVSEA